MVTCSIDLEKVFKEEKNEKKENCQGVTTT